MDENLKNAKEKFQRWLHIFQRNCQDSRLNALQKEIEDLNYQITDSGEERFVGEDTEFQYLSMDAIGLLNFRGDEVMRKDRVAFRMPKIYTASKAEETPATPASDQLEQEALRIACDKFVVWVSKFRYACINRDLEFLEQELHTLGFYIEIGESALVEESPLRNVFMANVSLFRRDGTWVATKKGVIYNAPPHYDPNSRLSAVPSVATPMRSNNPFASEDLAWLTTASGNTTRWPTPEDEAIISEAQKSTADH